MNIAKLPELLKPGPTALRSGVQVGGKQNPPNWGEIVTTMRNQALASSSGTPDGHCLAIA